MRKIHFFILTLLMAVGCLVFTQHLAVHAVTVDNPSPLQDNSKCAAKDQTQCIPDNNTSDATQKYCSNNNNCDLVAKYLNPFIKFLSILLGLGVTIGIIWGGIEYSSSAGDPQKSSTGKRHIIQAIVALIAYIFLYGLLKFLIPTGV